MAATSVHGRQLLGETPRPVRVWPILGVVVAFRLWYAGARQLLPDEAFYWDLSRHLQSGYLDHPPLLAVLVRLSTLLLGTSELGVRLVAVAFGFAALALLLKLCDRLLGDARAKLFLVLLWLASPLFHALAGVVTPDTPAVFFSLCGLGSALTLAARLEHFGRRAADAHTPPRTAGPWLMLGAFSGLGMLSKYTTVLLPGSVVLALLTHPAGRRELLRPWPYVAGAAALAVFSPVIYWNATHGWVSFQYQLHHGLNTGAKVNHWKDFGEYVGGQILVFTPVLFALAAVVMFACWRGYKALALSRRVLVWAATVPLVFFGYAATRSHGEANWPAFGYFPMSLLMAEFLLRRGWSGAAMKWAKIGCVVALAGTILLHAPELVYKLMNLDRTIRRSTAPPRPLPRKLNDLFGWREMGRYLGQVAAVNGGLPVVCNTHEDAGEAAFYMPGRPDVWCVSLGKNSRPTSFDYLPGGPDLRRAGGAILVNGNAQEFRERYGFVEGERLHWFAFLNGHERDRYVDVCRRP